MKILHFSKAYPVADEVVEPVSLIFDSALPDVTDRPEWEHITRNFLESEGRGVAQALLSVMPQGVVDALLVALLDQKRTLLAVKAHTPKESK